VTRPHAVAVLAIFACALAACGGGGSSSSPTATATPSGDATPTAVAFGHTDLTYPGGTLHVEVAATPAQSERGLGYRDALAPDAGMLFDLGETRVQEFWMKGMRFALDMVWIGEDKRVVEVTPDVQPQPGADDSQLARYPSVQPVRYALELNAGAAARLGITPGAQLAFEIAR
jgi:uncharacterized membrane protein (UPF0127 family)